MATPKVRATVLPTWVDVIGDAAGVPGVTWQNLGPDVIEIAFTTAQPAENSSTDAIHLLAAGDGFYDETGSAHCWVRNRTQVMGAVVSATAK